MKSLLPALLVACSPLVAAAMTQDTSAAEPWAFTAPTPRAQQSTSSDNTSPTSLDQETRRYFDTAMAALASNDINQAAQQIQQALVLAPDHATLLSMAGRIYTRQHSFGLAANCWRHLLSIYPSSATLQAELGATLLYMGKDKEARAALENALAVSPGDLTVRYYRGMLYIKDREFDAAADMFTPLSGPQILQTINRLQEDRDLIVTLTSSEGYRGLARAVLNSKTGEDTEDVLATVKRMLQELQPVMQAGQWSKAAPLLRSIYQAGARFPALEYDIGLCQYGLKPGPEPLDALEKLVTSPRGAGFRRLFAYLCLQAQDAARADRALSEFLKAEPDIEAVLIRAAIRQGLNDEAGAWELLESLPTQARVASQPWFQRDMSAIQQLKNSDRYAAWLKPKKSE